MATWMCRVLVLLISIQAIRCATGCNIVHCKADPCIFVSGQECSNHPHAECRANYCGGCYTEFWEGGVKIEDCVDLTQIG